MIFLSDENIGQNKYSKRSFYIELYQELKTKSKITDMQNPIENETFMKLTPMARLSYFQSSNQNDRCIPRYLKVSWWTLRLSKT